MDAPIISLSPSFVCRLDVSTWGRSDGRDRRRLGIRSDQDRVRIVAGIATSGEYASGQHPRQARWSAAKRLGSDGGLGLLVRLPIPGKKIRDFVGRVIWKAGEHVGEPGLGIDVVHFAGLDQGIDGGGTMAASI
jgi:hypothetical protein